MARKTKTSVEVKQRYIDKTYKRYLLSLRNDTDAALIAKIEALKASGMSANEAVKYLITKNKGE